MKSGAMKHQKIILKRDSTAPPTYATIVPSGFFFFNKKEAVTKTKIFYYSIFCMTVTYRQ